ncbi:MAG: hypothetical protein R3B13_37290 [Polyangiaceae bacterium]
MADTDRPDRPAALKLETRLAYFCAEVLIGAWLQEGLGGRTVTSAETTLDAARV